MILIPGDAAWPSGLDDLGEQAPYVLWTRGAQSISATTSLSDRAALTGARAASQYGTHVAADLARDLAERERVVVTGGAHGIEAAALRGALSAGGHTIAVQPSGLDRPYPHGNRELLEGVKDRGLLISELPPRAQPTRQRMVARGRLLAALSGATVVVEAAARSGAIATAQSARSLGRQVGAVPGPVTSITSAGPHRLLAEGAAKVITGGEEITRLLDTGKTPGPDRELAPPAATRTGPSPSGSGLSL
ncbi:DNA protecting protein DprA [Tamaricihabitans halophyticus]|uniref:DNA protecting protein DprA n=1 Tax=Tamaricihabitans halophyticus TaxID=1262583 RepID=A0A4R2R675_9PSEU|nr:DNA-processing protein DprA [Tamaricihabitans halophyticus]TCP57554.1 DNA protecting protein DprA [Tamaricihabitans halophyticus]